MTLPPLPEGALPLDGVTVTARPGGAAVYAEPSAESTLLGTLAEGEQRAARGLIFGAQTWLAVPWTAEREGWAVGEDTDFARTSAYSQVAEAWYEAGPVLAFRRSLVRDFLRARGASRAERALVDALQGAELRDLEESLAREAVTPAVQRFQALAQHLGLPAPFELLPVHTAPASDIATLVFSGFGPNTEAFEYGEVYYTDTRAMHSGVDFSVPEGSPLIAVADGVIVDFPFMANRAERTLALRPYLPADYRRADGTRVLSNVIVGYAHLTGDPSSELVRVGDEVRAGQIIGTSGWPVYTRDDGSVAIQGNNAHLHVEVHLVTDGTQALGSQQPFNPLLFWSARMGAFQARLAANTDRPPYPQEGQPWGRLGFFTIGCFRTGSDSSVWRHEPSADAIWPEGVYDMEDTLRTVEGFKPYALDGSSAF